MPIIHECCCGASLKTGSILVGLFYMGASLMQLAFELDTYLKVYDEDLHFCEYGFNKLLQSDIMDRIRNTAETVHHDLVKAVITLQTVHIVFLVTDAICDLLLLFGAIREKAVMLLTWLVAETLVLIALTVIRIIYHTLLGSFLRLYVGIIHVTFPLVLYLYFALVVYSYYQTLTENPSE